MARVEEQPESHRGRTLLRVVLGALILFVGAIAASRIDVGRSRADDHRPERGYDAEGRAVEPIAPRKGLPNLIVIVVDTMRWDGMVPRADGRPLMPNLARLATEGVSFPDASSTAPWTMPAVGSLLTGLLPSEHGNLDARRPPALAAAVTTYAEILSQSFGYETLAFVDAPWFGGPQAFLQGFYSTASGFHLQGVETDVGDWAKRRKRERPFFLLLHTNEAHEPYGAANHAWPRPAFDPAQAAALAELPDADLEPWEMARIAFLDLPKRDALGRRMGLGFIHRVVRYIGQGYAEAPRPDLAAEFHEAYDAGLHWVDGLLQTSFDRFRAWGLLDDTLLVVTSDHGESFGEHGQLGHGRQLYDELLRIPLVMKGPAPFTGGRAAAGSVSLMDVMPTFLDWIKAPPLQGVTGVSLLPVLRGESSGRPVFAEENLNTDNTQRTLEASLHSVRNESFKYVLAHDRTAGTVRQELYDLAKDPYETEDLLAGSTGGRALPADVCEAIGTVRKRAARVASSDAEVAKSAYSPSTSGVASFAGLPEPCKDADAGSK